MKIAAVYTVKDEADILELSLRHMLAEGIDHIYVADGMSKDGSFELLERLEFFTHQVTTVTDMKPYHAQPYWIELLAEMAHEDGHEWIVASDADEFWYATNGGTVADAIKALPSTVNKLMARSYQHYTWDTRQIEPKRLPKVAYRWSPNARVTNGNHDVSVDGGTYGVVDIRELQFRDFDHFCRKVKDRCATLDPSARARGDGSHITRLEGLDDNEMRREWDFMMSTPVVQDPIPTHLPSLL